MRNGSTHVKGYATEGATLCQDSTVEGEEIGYKEHA